MISGAAASGLPARVRPGFALAGGEGDADKGGEAEHDSSAGHERGDFPGVFASFPHGRPGFLADALAAEDDDWAEELGGGTWWAWLEEFGHFERDWRAVGAADFDLVDERWDHGLEEFVARDKFEERSSVGSHGGREGSVSVSWRQR